jgi:thymidylate synthase
MSKIDLEFHKLCSTILDEGVEYNNVRRGVTRLQIPSYTFKHSFKDGFPAITNKKLPFKSIIGELIWFLRGDNDVKYLNDNGIKIWNKDAYNWYLKEANKYGFGRILSEEEFNKEGEGSVGRNYSRQWRDFNGVDQIVELIEGMKKDIMGSRLKVSAWNPAELDQTALPPCHDGFQIIGVPLPGGKFGFEMHWNQRSVDTFLGLPFNIASYAALAKILEHITGYKALGIEGTLKCVHFYDNQIEAVKELLTRDPMKHGECELRIDSNIVWNTFKDFSNVQIEDFRLTGYTSDAAIKVDMLAPKTDKI